MLNALLSHLSNVHFVELHVIIDAGVFVGRKIKCIILEYLAVRFGDHVETEWLIDAGHVFVQRVRHVRQY